MSILTIRLTDEIEKQVNQIARKLHVSRNEYIKKCIIHMNTNIYDQELKDKLINASKRVRKESMIVNAEFDDIEYE